jgi:transcriptional regulator NrdR family protein
MLSDNPKNTSESLENLKLGYADILDAQLNLNKNLTVMEGTILSAGDELVKWDISTSKVIKSLGVGAEYSAIIKQELGRASTEIYRMGGTQEEIIALQTEYAKTLQRTSVLTTENAEKMFAVSKVTGIASGELEKSFRNAGMETTHINDEMTTVVQTSRNLGVNAQVVSAMVVGNLDKMNRYGFGTGVEGMAKMASKAAAMRVDMSQTLAVADKLFSPESAIDVAASLQRLGATSGALLDPLKLMDLAQNNVPELQNQLSELSKTFTKFDKETGKFQIMPQARQQLKEVADALGIDRAEFEKMAIESAKIEKKMGEIDFGGLQFKATDDQKMMLANMAEFNKSKGSYEITVKDANGEFIQKSLQSLTDADLEQIKQRQEFEKKDSGLQLVDLAKEQLLASQQLVAEQKALGSLLTTQYAIGKTGNDFLTNAITTQNETFSKTYESLSLKKGTGEGAVAEFQNVITEVITKLAKGETPDFTIVQEKLGGILGQFSEIMSDNEQRKSKANVAVEMYSDLKLATASITLANEIQTKFATTVQEATGNLKGWQQGLALTIPLLKQAYDAFVKKPEEKTIINTSTNTGNLNQQNSGNNNNSSSSNQQTNQNNSTAQVNKIEHKIELTVKTDINNTEVAAAVTKAFSNDDTLRELRTAIAEVASDYGLTVT